MIAEPEIGKLHFHLITIENIAIAMDRKMITDSYGTSQLRRQVEDMKEIIGITEAQDGH